MTRSQRFAFACLFELGLLGLAFVLAGLLDVTWTDSIRVNAANILQGIVAATPMFALLWWVLSSPLEPVAKVREFLDRSIGLLFHDWTWWQVAVLAALAGVGEESLFRGVIQGGLEGSVGAWSAILIASLIFAGVHFVSWAYGFLSWIAGLYLGTIFWLTDDLMVSILAHAVYDFVAMSYLMRTRPR
jgi:hypothetical protein